MPLPRRVRTSLINRYAISDGQTLPYELEYSKRAGVWIQPYVGYGLGVQKSWEYRFTAFVQAMIRQGGKNGVALSVGCKLSLGKDSKPIERVQNNIKVASKPSNINSKFNILTPQEITQRANSMGFNRIN